MVTSLFSCDTDKQESEAETEKGMGWELNKPRGVIGKLLAQILRLFLSTCCPRLVTFRETQHKSERDNLVFMLHNNSTHQLSANQLPQHLVYTSSVYSIFALWLEVYFNALIQMCSCSNTSLMSAFKCAKVIHIQELTTSWNTRLQSSGERS